jgi:PAS domain S-box-containing protein
MPVSKKARSRKAQPQPATANVRQKRESDYHSFFEYAYEGFFRGSPDGRFTEVNPALVRMLGYDSREKVLALSFVDDVWTEARDWERLREELDTSSVGSSRSVVWKKKDGTRLSVSLQMRTVKNTRGRVVTYEGAVRESTAPKRSEKNWQTGEHGFRTFLESTHSATFVFQGSRLLYANPAAEVISGYSQEELMELSFWEILHPDFRQLVKSRGLARQRGENVPTHYEVKIITKNGEERWLDFASSVIELEGKPAVVGTAFDVTARKQTEAELEKNCELFQGFMDNSPAGAYLKDEAGKYVYTSKAIERYFPTMIGKTDFDVFPPTIAKQLRENDMAALMAGRISKFDETTEGMGGELHWTTFKFPVLAASGKRFLAGLSIDTTKQKKLEEQLRESEERYRTVSEITSDYAYALQVDASGKLTLEWITSAFSRISGLTEDEVVARGGWTQLPHPDDMETVQRHRDAVLAGQEQTCELRLIAKSGDIRWVRDSMRPVWDREQGRVVRIYGAGQDITERKRLEEQLRERIIQPKDLGANLRRFRQQLGLTQSVFGQAFGGYSQRQITSYETGEIEIPMGLLLSIRNKGYPLEVVLGESQTDALDTVVGYLSSSWKIHETAKRLTESVLRLLDRESATINSIMGRLGIEPEADGLRENYTLQDMLRRAGVESTAAAPLEETTEPVLREV